MKTPKVLYLATTTGISISQHLKTRPNILRYKSFEQKGFVNSKDRKLFQTNFFRHSREPVPACAGRDPNTFDHNHEEMVFDVFGFLDQVKDMLSTKLRMTDLPQLLHQLRIRPQIMNRRETARQAVADRK